MHELRTPLAVAATNLDLAVTTPGLDADVGSHLAAARRGVERLARTVDDLATHGRLSVGDDGAIDLAVEVRALADEHGGLARARGLTLHVEGPDRLVVAADRAAVHTAVGNLLANAVRLAPSGSIVSAGHRHLGRVGVDRRARRGSRPARRRSRAGVPALLARALRPRPRTPARAAPDGLGLTICRQVTEAQGGHVTVRSAIGVGLDLRGLAAALGRRPHGRRGRGRRHPPPGGPAARPPRPRSRRRPDRTPFWSADCSQERAIPLTRTTSGRAARRRSSASPTSAALTSALRRPPYLRRHDRPAPVGPRPSEETSRAGERAH